MTQTADAAALVRREIARAGSHFALARQWGVRPNFVSALAAGTRRPGPDICARLGVMHRKRRPAGVVSTSNAARTAAHLADAAGAAQRALELRAEHLAEKAEPRNRRRELSPTRRAARDYRAAWRSMSVWGLNLIAAIADATREVEDGATEMRGEEWMLFVWRREKATWAEEVRVA